MNTSESISNLFNLGVKHIEIGVPPQEYGKPFIVKAIQFVASGDDGNSQLNHNVLSETIGDGLAKMTDIVKAAHKLHRAPSAIIQAPKSRING